MDKFMYTYDFTDFFSFKSWMKKELSCYDKLGQNAYDDLCDDLKEQFNCEVEFGIIHEINL